MPLKRQGLTQVNIIYEDLICNLISFRPEGLLLEDAAIIVLYTMELHPREASLCKLVNSALREYHDLFEQSVSNAIDKLRPFASFIWLLNTALQKLPPLDSKVVYKGVSANFSDSDEYR